MMTRCVAASSAETGTISRSRGGSGGRGCRGGAGGGRSSRRGASRATSKPGSASIRGRAGAAARPRRAPGARARSRSPRSPPPISLVASRALPHHHYTWTVERRELFPGGGEMVVAAGERPAVREARERRPLLGAPDARERDPEARLERRARALRGARRRGEEELVVLAALERDRPRVEPEARRKARERRIE